MMKEPRLIGYTVSSLERQRRKAGVKETVIPANQRQVNALADQQSAGVQQRSGQDIQDQAARGLTVLRTNTGVTNEQYGTLRNDLMDSMARGQDKVAQGQQLGQQAAQQLQDAGLVAQNAEKGLKTSLNQETGELSAVYRDPRNPAGFVAPGANVGDQRFDTMAARSAGRGAARKLQDIGNGDVATIEDLKANGITSWQQLLGNTQTVEGIDYLILGPGQYVRLPSDIADQFRQEEQAARDANAAADRQKVQERAMVTANSRQLATQPQNGTQTGPGQPNPLQGILPQPRAAQQIQGLFQAVQGDSSLAKAYMPTILSLQSRAQNLERQLATSMNAAQADPAFLSMLATDMDFQQRAMTEGRRIAEEDKNLQIEAAEELGRIMKLQEEKAQIARVRDETLLKQQTQEREIRNRRLVNATGMDTDSQALSFLEEERTRAEMLLRDMQEEHRLEAAIAGKTIALTYKSAIDNAISVYNAKDLQLQANYNQEKREIMNLFNLDKKERQARIDKALEGYFTGMDKLDTDYAGMLKEARVEAIGQREKAVTRAIEAEKLEYDRGWDRFKLEFDRETEMLKFGQQQAERDENQMIRLDQNFRSYQAQITNQISSRIANDKIIQEANQVALKYDAMSDVYERAKVQANLYDQGKIDKDSMNFTDQALINNFNKLTDPQSVVRESEYARSAQGMSLIESLRAKYSAFKKGGVLSEAERKELYDVAATLHDSYQSTLQVRQQPYLLQLERYNSNVPPEYRMTPDEFQLQTGSQGVDAEFQRIKGEVQGGPFTNYGGGSFKSVQEWIGNVGTGKVMQSFNTKIGYKVHGKNIHQGLDIDGKVGDPIPAFSGGKVVSARFKPGWGNQVVIQDKDGYRYQYSHLHGFKVKEGDSVNAGSLIATMGNTGHVIPGPSGDGSHLDFEVFDPRGNVIDPERYHEHRMVAFHSSRP